MPTDQIFERLLRAFWRGEFEDEFGNSRLTYDGKPQGRHFILQAITNMNRQDRINLPKLTELMDADRPWMLMKDKIPFDSLASLRIDGYNSEVKELFLDQLTMTAQDLRRWHKRLQNHEYES
jgi:hypothetical protein